MDGGFCRCCFCWPGSALPAPKARFGEWLPKAKARRRLPAGIYRPFHDVTIPDGAAGTTQIDHVFVSPCGLFVVETKTCTGWIFGAERDARWTQTIGRFKHRFQNPLRQNHKHVIALARLLGIDCSRGRSVVAFTGDATFKTGLPANVRTLADFDQCMRGFQETVFTEQELHALCAAIRLGRLAPGHATNMTHRRNLQKRHGARHRVCV